MTTDPIADRTRWALLLFAVPAALYGLAPVATYDIWWHLATGREIIATGSLLPVDPFSYTHAEVPWPYKDWGAALLLHGLHRLGGAAAIVIMKAVVVAGLVGAVAWTLIGPRRVAVAPAAVTLAIFLPAVAFRLTERPALFSFALTAVVLLLIERHRRGEGRLLWVVPVTILIANLHRGVILVPVVMTAYCIACAATADGRRRLRSALIATALCAAGSIATPFGFAAFTGSAGILGGAGFRGDIPEWEMLSLGALWQASPATLLIAGALLALWTLALARREKPRPWDVALSVLAIAVPMAGVRFVPYAALFAAPVIASALDRFEPVRSGRLRHHVAAAALIAATGVAAGSPHAGLQLGVAADRFPVAGVAEVRRLRDSGELAGRMLNEFGLGGYVLFHLWPTFKVYVDGRNDFVYAERFIARYPQVLRDAALLRSEAEHYDVGFLFLHNRPYAGERAHLGNDPLWVLVHATGRSLIYVDAKRNPELAKARGYRFLRPHRLLPALEEAWARSRPGDRETIVAEAERMVAEDPRSVPANVVLAAALELVGPTAIARQKKVLARLKDLGWSPPAAQK